MNSRIKQDVQRIFEFWCEVGKLENEHNNNDNSNKALISNLPSGIIIKSFPESYYDEQIITKIPDFAYPCKFENESVQSYSFVLTSDDSKWRFGFCRHDPKTQTAMVIITYLPWHDTFLRLLSVLGELRRNKNGDFESFLAEAYNKAVPELGASLKLFYNSGQNHFIFQCPSQFQLPSIPENHNLNLYYNFVEPKNMISVFAAMLAERRIIFTSRRFDKLSSCVQAANAFLYPMVWQHIFIPVLPMKMKDILSAPMPYLIGVPEAVLQTMTPEELGDVVILNCDNGIFQSPFDDVKPIPSEIIQSMKKQLNNSNDHIGDRVSKIFLGVLVQLIGGYRDAVMFTQEQRITWDRDTFIESRPPHLRLFLTKMMELQIFQQFIEERLEMLNTGLGFSDEFELETLRYSEKIGRRGKHYKEFLRNVKEKTNPAVKSAVKSVKEGSRGVKTVYKDLKLKLRDITPPKSSSSQFYSHISSLPSSVSSTTKSELQGNRTIHIENRDRDGATATFHHHRSAPTSPNFSRRMTNTDDNTMAISPSSNISNLTTNTQKSKEKNILQISNSQVLNSLKNSNNSCNPKNPTNSPSSSSCSSDMNISQELQNHPLFKTPVVDRSLKPNSLECHGNNKLSSITIKGEGIGAKYSGSSVTIPKTSSLSYQQPTSQSADNILISNLCIIDDDKDENNLIKNEKIGSMTSQYYSTTNSIFDVPPDMPSPPVPPKRINLNNYKKSTTTNSSNNTESAISVSSRGKQNLRKNSVASVPTPEHRIKEISFKSEEKPKTNNFDATKDLISLDDSNVNFELEDFDPLHKSSKKFPSFFEISQQIQQNQYQQRNNCINQQTSINNFSLPPMSSGAATATSSSSVNNFIYPYFSSQHRHTTPKISEDSTAKAIKISSTTNKDDDFELLRKYGLDQFTLTTTTTATTVTKTTNGNSELGNSTTTKSGWMIFD